MQLTWSTNYQRVDSELGWEGPDSCYWEPDNVLKPVPAAIILFLGMAEGWFREGETLEKYFNADDDNPYGAREIINGDKNYTPDWANGASIGSLIADYHAAFLMALTAAYANGSEATVEVIIRAPAGVSVVVHHEEI